MSKSELIFTKAAMGGIFTGLNIPFAFLHFFDRAPVYLLASAIAGILSGCVLLGMAYFQATSIERSSPAPTLHEPN